MSKEQHAEVYETAIPVEEPTAAQSLVNAFRVKEATFLVELATPGGAKFAIQMRSVRGTMQLTQLKKKAKKFFRMMNNNPPPAYKPYAPLDEEAADMVTELVELAVEPKFTDIEALQLAHYAGPVLLNIHAKFLEHIGGNAGVTDAEKDADELETAKN